MTSSRFPRTRRDSASGMDPDVLFAGIRIPPYSAAPKSRPMAVRTAVIQQKRKQLRATLYPSLEESRVWSRKGNAGFTTTPRTLNLILTILDRMSEGKPVSSTYFELWCRAYDEMLVALTSPSEMAFYSGFTGQRSERIWRERMQILADLGFIDLKPGPRGPMSYALIWNPYLVIEEHYRKGTKGLTEAAYNALKARAIEIGAIDLTPPAPPEEIAVPAAAGTTNENGGQQ